MKVDECPAGPWMDAAVAEVLGSKAFYDWPEGWEHVKSCNWNEVPFSTSLAAAWHIWNDDMTIHRIGVLYHCLLSPEYGYGMELLLSKADASGITLALTICRAFLKANGVTEIDCGEK